MLLDSIISTVSAIVSASSTWLSTAVGTVTTTPIIMFFLMVNFVGIGIGLFKRLTRI